jgi:Transposase DDE domain
MITNDDRKINELVSILKDQHFNSKINLARVKLIAMFIMALCKVQTVTFHKLASAFDSQSKADSSLRRLQRFIATFTLDSDLIARLIFSLLPIQGKVQLSLDRTNWKFGITDINILMLGVVYKGVAFPLLFTLLPKRGNSNTSERIMLIDRYIQLFSIETIECVVADREFVGESWLAYLNQNNIRYYIRIRNNFKVYIPSKNKEIKASWLFNNCQINEFRFYPNIVRVNGELCYISGSKLNGNDFLVIVSFNEPVNACDFYKQRWQIEMCFKSMKSSGFDIEKTHLTDLDRIEKLTLLIMIAFVWCYKVGIHLNEKIKPIEIKKHGRKAESIFKYGLKQVANYLLNPEYHNISELFQFLSCT